ncbi:MAG TPA: hypothetical protein VF120_07145 [Ktedonobacterales bacterium]
MSSSTLFADVTPLLEAIAATDEQQVIAQTLNLLGPQRVPASRLAGSVGLAALWGGADPLAIGPLSVSGLLSRWIVGMPLGPEPSSEAQRKLAPALPLVQSFLAVAQWVRGGLAEPHPQLPEPLLPAEIQHAQGPLGALRDAVGKGDATTAERILLGYFATGADYRSFLASLFGALEFRYPADGHPLVYAQEGARILDMTDWGGNMPPLIAWLSPHLGSSAPDIAPAQAARAFAQAAGHDLLWLRTRLAAPQEGAAGPEYQRALLAGDAAAACAATLTALRAGATPRGVAGGMALAVASRINAVRQGDLATLLRAGEILQYVHAVHVGMSAMQDPHVWPVLYTAAAVVNTLNTIPSAPLETGRAAAVSAGGGTLPATMLRSLEEQVSAGDATSALATARRYMMMGSDARAVAGVIGGMAAMRDLAGGSQDALQAMPLVAVAADEYLRLPAALSAGGQNALLAAAIRLASELRGSHALGDRVRAAIQAELAVPR